MTAGALKLLVLLGSVTCNVVAQIQDEDTIHLGVLLPFSLNGVPSGLTQPAVLTAAVYADLELGKYQNPPKREFRDANGTLLPHYAEIPNVHPNLTKVKMHLRDSKQSREHAAAGALAFAFGVPEHGVPAMNAIIGPLRTEPITITASMFGALDMVQICPLGGSASLADKQEYPFLFRALGGDLVYGHTFVEYLEFFRFRGAHFIYEDQDQGHSIRSGVFAAGDAMGRSSDISFMILPFLSTRSGEADVQAATSACEAARDAVRSSTDRLILTSIRNDNPLGRLLRRTFRLGGLVAPSIQFMITPFPRNNFREGYEEGHPMAVMHGIMTPKDYTQESIRIMRESWTQLSVDEIIQRLPEYGTDLWDHPVDTSRLGDWFFDDLPPNFGPVVNVHGSINMMYRAFNLMLWDGYAPRDIKGAALKDYLFKISFCGFGECWEFNSNQDVIEPITIEYLDGYHENGQPMWPAGAIRMPPTNGNEYSTLTLTSGSAGMRWANGVISRYPPPELAACPFGTAWRPRSPGGTPETDLGRCEVCPGGTFSDMYNALTCELCPAGTVSNEGSMNCTTCPERTFAPEGSSTCIPCFEGSFGDEAGASACRNCPEGSFQNSSGQSACVLCPVGTNAFAVRSQQCSDCRPGSIAASQGLASCVACAAGQFQTESQSTACSPCSRGSFAAESGQSQCTVCSPGSYQANASSAQACERCPVGMYSETAGASSCDECSFGTTQLLGADSKDLCTCPAGTFYFETPPAGGEGMPHRQCLTCNEYVLPCQIGTTQAYQKEGYHLTLDGQTVYRCASTGACPGGPLWSCPEGSSGPGCAECDDGTHYWDGEKCAKCTTASAFIIAVVLVAGITVAVATHWFGNDPIGKKLSAISEGIVLAGLSLSVLFFLSSFSAMDVEWKEPVKSLIDMSQFLSTELTNVNFACSVTMGPAAAMAMTGAIPICIAFACAIVAMLRLASPKHLFNTSGSIIYAIYLLLILHVLKPFRYIVHPLAPDNSVLAEPSVFQGSDEHSRMMVVSIAMIVAYCVPYTAACTWASFAIVKSTGRHRRFLLKTFRFLFYKFEPQAFYWGFLILMRNTAFALVPSLLPERPYLAIFVLAVLTILSSVLTTFVCPWRTRWMNVFDVGILVYLSLVLLLAVGWIRSRDSSGFLATLLVVVAGTSAGIVAVFALRLLVRIIIAGKAGREEMRKEMLAQEEQLEKKYLDHFSQYDQQMEVADAFDALQEEQFPQKTSEQHERLAPGLLWVAKQPFNLKEVARIANSIRDKDYPLDTYCEDLTKAFPELQLYTSEDGMPPDPPKSDGLQPKRINSSSGLSGEAELMRTFGAFFAIYWLCRLDIDGRRGFAFGMPDKKHDSLVAMPRDSAGKKRLEDLKNMPWGQMSEEQKRMSFYHHFNWDLMASLFRQAGIVSEKNGRRKSITIDSGAEGRLVALLCLTAFHDIMKNQPLCPKVAGDSYGGIQQGEVIQDHDLALSYILDRHPDVLPSYRVLSESQKRVIRFTQSEMGFNAGWLVQAEGPPCAVLSKLKKAIVAGMAGDCDVSFYFAHWVTDLAGAEPTPFQGSEKLVVKFPTKVLQGLLSCFGVVQQLATDTETEVYERFMETRWKEMSEVMGPVPTGHAKVARLRLHCMAQAAAKPLLDAFDKLELAEPDTYNFLVQELSATGLQEQSFTGTTPAMKVDTPFLAYYGPAWCQRMGQQEPLFCLQVLAEVLKQARETMERSSEKVGRGEGVSWTLQLAALRTVNVEDLKAVSEMGLGTCLETVQTNSLECNLVINMVSA